MKPSVFDSLLMHLRLRFTTSLLVPHSERGSLSSHPDPPLTTTRQKRVLAL